jgi:hypothetical protein
MRRHGNAVYVSSASASVKHRASTILYPCERRAAMIARMWQVTMHVRRDDVGARRPGRV